MRTDREKKNEEKKEENNKLKLKHILMQQHTTILKLITIVKASFI